MFKSVVSNASIHPFSGGATSMVVPGPNEGGNDLFHYYYHYYHSCFKYLLFVLIFLIFFDFFDFLIF